MQHLREEAVLEKYGQKKEQQGAYLDEDEVLYSHYCITANASERA